MCHPAAIVLSTDVSFLPSQEIKGVTVSFQLPSSSQSSPCPFPTVAALAGGVQLCVYREGRVQLPGLDPQTTAWEHLNQPGPSTAPEWVELCQRVWAEPSVGTAVPAGAFAVVLPFSAQPASSQDWAASSPLGKLPCRFIWKVTKMKHGDFLCSVVDLEKTEMTAAVLC